MFALVLNYLNGWAMAASDGAEKRRAEWPPHPDRVFMALAAAWFETDEDAAEGEVLRWLEGLPPPRIAASNHKTRSVVSAYVPVNDTHVKSTKFLSSLEELKNAGLAILPEYRTRKERGFPVAIPYDPEVRLIWPDTDLGPRRAGLERLASKVTHVGHSASFVQAWVEEDGEITAEWEPSDGITRHRLRVPRRGRLDELITLYNRDDILEYARMKTRAAALRGKNRQRLDKMIKERYPHAPQSLRPTPVRWQGYDRVQETAGGAPGSVFDPNLVILAVKGRRVPLTATLKLTRALHGALMASCTAQPPPEWLSGHKSDGSPSTKPHLALTPLPFAGSRYADGSIMGMALALPRNPDPGAWAHLEAFLRDPDGLPREHRLFDGKWFECAVNLKGPEHPQKNLNADTWTRESRVWASVTPVALNRHFNGDDKWDRAAEGIMDACVHIGLPRPKDVLPHPVSYVRGAPHAKKFPMLRRKSDGGRRSHTHAVIIFDEHVRGPVLLGAGRYRGYGLFRPMGRGGGGHA